MDNSRLKFRAWDVKGRRMIKGANNIMIDGAGNMFWQFGMDDPEMVGREEYIPMQYTGLKDKNGKDIFQGDVIVAHEYPFYSDGNHNYSAVVEWDYGAWYYGIYPVSDRVRGSACGSQLHELWEGGRVEVIGNIYENPELLEDAI